MESEETLDLIANAQSGDRLASETLVSKNSPLIKSVIRRYKNRGIDYDDLYQLGCMGFIKAIKNFSPTYQVRFSTYAVPMIAGEVKRFLRDDGPIKVSRGTKTAAIKMNRFIESYKLEHNDSPTIELIAQHFGIEAQEAVFILDSNKQPLSIYDRNDEDSTRTLLDKLQTPDTEDERLDKMMLKRIIDKLPPRDKKIILLRYFADKTQSEVARVLNVSQVQVSRLENKILSKIRQDYSTDR